MTDILKALAAPLPADAVEWRVGSTTANKDRGMALAYIDARTVQDRLADVCGALWQCEHTVSADGKKITCRIGVKIGEEWIWRSDGAGETDFEAEKGAYSDAFKRAGVKWGIGRYLYDMGAPWVAIEAMGKSFKIADSEKPRLLVLAAGGKPAASPPPVKPAEKAPGGFWTRPSYEIKGTNIPDLLAFSVAFQKACQQAPTLDALSKLEADNADHLAALNNQAPSDHKKARTALGNAQLIFTQKAA